MRRRSFFVSVLLPFLPKPKPTMWFRPLEPIDLNAAIVPLSIARHAFQQAMEAAVTEAIGSYGFGVRPFPEELVSVVSAQTEDRDSRPEVRACVLSTGREWHSTDATWYTCYCADTAHQT